MMTVDEYKRRTTSGRTPNSGQRRPVSPNAHNRARAAARRHRKRRRRRIILGLGLLVLLIAAAVIGIIISGQKKNRDKVQAEGIAYLDQGNYDAAIQSFTQILDKSKGKTGKQEKTVLLYKAEAEYKKGDYQAALATSDALIAADGEKDEYLKLKSRCQMELGDYNAALSYQPLIPVVYNRKAVEAINEGRYEDALAAIKNGLAVGESEALQSLLWNQAVVYVNTGDYEKALGLLESYEQKYGSDENITKQIEFLKTR